MKYLAPILLLILVSTHQLKASCYRSYGYSYYSYRPYYSYSYPYYNYCYKPVVVKEKVIEPVYLRYLVAAPLADIPTYGLTAVTSTTARAATATVPAAAGTATATVPAAAGTATLTLNQIGDSLKALLENQRALDSRIKLIESRGAGAGPKQAASAAGPNTKVMEYAKSLSSGVPGVWGSCVACHQAGKLAKKTSGGKQVDATSLVMFDENGKRAPLAKGMATKILRRVHQKEMPPQPNDKLIPEVSDADYDVMIRDIENFPSGEEQPGSNRLDADLRLQLISLTSERPSSPILIPNRPDSSDPPPIPLPRTRPSVRRR